MMDPPNPHTSEPQPGDFSDFSADPMAVPDIGNTEETPLEVGGEADVEATNVAEETPLDIEPLHAEQHEPSDDPDDSADQMNQYMASLMQRYGMDTTIGQMASKSVSPTDSSQAASNQSATPAPTQPTEPREPSVPPETWSDMAAMRELANLSATRAIQKHSSEQLTKQALVKLLLSVAAMGVALAMAELSVPGKTVLFAAAVLMMACATLWGGQFLLTTRKLLDNLAKGKASQTPEVTPTEEDTEAGAALVRRLAQLQGKGNPRRSHDDEPA